jgi:hypothetical protein
MILQHSREIPGKGLRNRWAKPSGIIAFGRYWRRGNPSNLIRFIPA